MLTIALPKGRLQGKTLARFAAAGLVPEEEPGSSRKLIVPARAGGPTAARFLVLKDGDVPLYVERGAADLGVCGLDQLLESGADVLSPVDLGFGRCRLCLAAPRARLGGAQPSSEAAFTAVVEGAQPGTSLRVATKYPRLALRAFARRGVPVDLVRLSGSVELAAVAGLSDVIVDLVESGRTLEENGLVIAAELLQVSARLVVNRASYRLKLEDLLPLLARVGPDLESAGAAP
ncbi:MAG: ATP phosphoribosyltransferase [Myxococcales bacterium]